MSVTVIGVDPSFTACGVSDGTRHAIIETRPRAEEESLRALRRRSLEITNGVLRLVGDWHNNNSIMFFIEAPMLRSGVNAGNHLLDLGWLMNDLISCIESEYQVTPVLVPTLTLKKFASGKGNTKKDEMKLAVFKKWGVEFDRDPGCDKLHAYCLHKYGEAVIHGDVEVTPIRRRGDRKKKAA